MHCLDSRTEKQNLTKHIHTCIKGTRERKEKEEEKKNIIEHQGGE
jgi:hypothetical protein